MAIVRYVDPFRGLSELEDEFNRMLREPFGMMTAQPSLTTPVPDVYVQGKSKNQELVVEAHLPNFNQDEIEINVHDGTLEIRAQHQEKDEDKKDRRYVLRESSASFYRRIGLPKNVNTDKINADFSDGVLKIATPYKKLPQPKKIAVKARAKK